MLEVNHEMWRGTASWNQRIVQPHHVPQSLWGYLYDGHNLPCNTKNNDPPHSQLLEEGQNDQAIQELLSPKTTLGKISNWYRWALVQLGHGVTRCNSQIKHLLHSWCLLVARMLQQ